MRALEEFVAEGSVWQETGFSFSKPAVAVTGDPVVDGVPDEGRKNKSNRQQTNRKPEPRSDTQGSRGTLVHPAMFVKDHGAGNS